MNIPARLICIGTKTFPIDSSSLHEKMRLGDKQKRKTLDAPRAQEKSAGADA
jgi:hypothetical protein